MESQIGIGYWVSVVMIASLISGIVSVAWSDYRRKKEEIRRMKFETLRSLFGYKHQLSLGVGKRNEFNKALNEIPVVFHKSKKVVLAHKNMYEIMINQQFGKPGRDKLVEDKLVTLYKNIFHDLGINIEKDLNDVDLLRTIT